MTHICDSELSHHWFRTCLRACSAPCNFNQYSDSFSKKNCLKMSSTKRRPFCPGFSVSTWKGALRTDMIYQADLYQWQCLCGALQWRHNERDGVSNYQPRDCLLNRLFKTQIKENIKVPRHWPLCREFTGDRWIPRTKRQWRGKCFHLMTSSWGLGSISRTVYELIIQSLQKYDMENSDKIRTKLCTCYNSYKLCNLGH